MSYRLIVQNIYYPDIKTAFSRVCPNLEHLGKKSTIAKQLQTLDPPGLTIIANIEKEYEALCFKNAIAKIQTKGGIGFCSSDFLHLTLLGLFNDKRELKQPDTERIIASTKEYIEKQNFGGMTLEFTLVRLGAFYDNGIPCDSYSDGTLIARADNKSPNVKKFNIIGNDLACHLRKSFPDIFYPDIPSRLQREHPTVWSTLGYFDGPDFDIDAKLGSVLEELKLFNASVTVSELEVRSYKVRSLQETEFIDSIRL